MVFLALCIAYTCVCDYICPCAWLWKPEELAGCIYCFSLFSFKTTSLTDLEAHRFGLAGWLVSSWDPPVSTSILGVTGMCCPTWLFWARREFALRPSCLHNKHSYALSHLLSLQMIFERKPQLERLQGISMNNDLNDFKEAGWWWGTPLIVEFGRQRQVNLWVPGQPGL